MCSKSWSNGYGNQRSPVECLNGNREKTQQPEYEGQPLHDVCATNARFDLFAPDKNVNHRFYMHDLFVHRRWSIYLLPSAISSAQLPKVNKFMIKHSARSPPSNGHQLHARNVIGHQIPFMLKKAFRHTWSIRADLSRFDLPPKLISRRLLIPSNVNMPQL